ncbi:hypothetical protein [Pseudomonas sp. UBA2684]|uniref:hypothetical protein n=1 Tax=Pseudomonas sp. UBA2684 TaxID=1947311 RepID=UPI000E81FDE0|nr:hypothetical protein [Pseudomonas sp. UBA2684]HBX55509.1 hypothetical protein [Pseudomonas sp.]|tara:strand:- start:539 stop:814 length:276 start_codon:yes stop_codon:yes gene_type:complete
MTKSLCPVIPFPKRFAVQDSSAPSACAFQTAAEQRVVLLHRLFNILSNLDDSGFARLQLKEACENAREMLNDVVVLYRSALAQAEGRAGDA